LTKRKSTVATWKRSPGFPSLARAGVPATKTIYQKKPTNTAQQYFSQARLEKAYFKAPYYLMTPLIQFATSYS